MADKNEALPAAEMDKKITVGIPAYNNASTIRRAIDSVLSQSESNFALIVSDDGSTDGTYAICAEYEAIDNRIRVIRQQSNLYYMNFRFLLECAATEYFCWLAGDDYLHQDFLANCLAELQQDEGLTCCTPKCQFFSLDSSQKFLSRGTEGIECEAKSDRLLSYFKDPADNSRMYGLFRKEILLKSFPEKRFHAYDWALIAMTLVYGKHREVDRVLLYREKTPTKNYSQMVKRDHRFILFRLFPVMRMSLYLWMKRDFVRNRRTLAALFWLNIEKHKRYMQDMLPGAYRRLKLFYDFYDTHIAWKLSPSHYLEKE